MVWWWYCKVGVCLPHFLWSVFFRLQRCLPVTSFSCAQFWPMTVQHRSTVGAKTWVGQEGWEKIRCIFLVWEIKCIWCMLLILKEKKKKKKANMRLNIFYHLQTVWIIATFAFCSASSFLMVEVEVVQRRSPLHSQFGFRSSSPQLCCSIAHLTHPNTQT